jgi:excisionase family DNA binding protein
MDTPPIAHTLPAAAELCGVSVRQLYNWHTAGLLPFVKVGRKTLIRHSDLVGLIDSLVVE